MPLLGRQLKSTGADRSVRRIPLSPTEQIDFRIVPIVFVLYL